MIHVAFAADDRYLPYCAVAMLSVLESRGRLPVTFHHLHGDDLTDRDADALSGLVERAGGTIAFHAIAEHELAGLPSVDRFGSTVWRRLRLPAHMPDLSRVLYLDADTFVVAPLDELWATDLGGRPLGAVPNVVEPAYWHRASDLGLSDMRQYFNSGVLLFDLDAVRAGDFAGRVEHAAHVLADRLVWPDQDALNVAFAGEWHAVHPRWNSQNSLRSWRRLAIDLFGADAVEEAVSRPAIVHFEGPDFQKPWHYLCRHPMTSRYRDSLARTPWAHIPIDGRTLVNRVARRLPLRWRSAVYYGTQRLDRHPGRSAVRR